MDEIQGEDKKMEIIKKIKKEWDWFETTKWLNIGTGILFSVGLFLIFYIINNWINMSNTSRVGIIIVLIGVEGLEFATSKMVKIIRENNTDINIKIK